MLVTILDPQYKLWSATIYVSKTKCLWLSTPWKYNAPITLLFLVLDMRLLLCVNDNVKYLEYSKFAYFRYTIVFPLGHPILLLVSYINGTISVTFLAVLTGNKKSFWMESSMWWKIFLAIQKLPLCIFHFQYIPCIFILNQ